MAEISSEIPSGMAKERASVSERVTGASRYLAAAAYHDRAFRRSVLEFAQHAWYGAPAPEFGINEAFVTEHCRAAERREHLRNALMLLAFLVVAHEPMGWFLSNPELAIRIIDSYGWNLILGVFAAATVLFVERLITEHFTPSKKFSRDAADGDIGSPQRNKDEEFQNLVVYGAYSPFVGSGYNIGGWSFSVNLERTRDENGGASGAMSFVSWDMLNFVSSRLDRLRISELRHYPVLFADGRLVKKMAESYSITGCLSVRLIRS